MPQRAQILLTRGNVTGVLPVEPFEAQRRPRLYMLDSAEGLPALEDILVSEQTTALLSCLLTRDRVFVSYAAYYTPTGGRLSTPMGNGFQIGSSRKLLCIP